MPTQHQAHMTHELSAHPLKDKITFVLRGIISATMSKDKSRAEDARLLHSRFHDCFKSISYRYLSE